jgi:hypothetical protein
MILEGIVTTTNPDGSANIAPMGPIVDGLPQRLRLRPFRGSTTLENLKRTGGGVFHVTDDVELLARAAVGALATPPATISPSQLTADLVASNEAARPLLAPLRVLAGACRWYAFHVERVDDSHERTEIDAQVLAAGRLRDFLGFNRAKHAVVEAAILATRTDLLPAEEIVAEFRRLKPLVEKTGGAAESRAFEFLTQFIHNALSVDTR